MTLFRLNRYGPGARCYDVVSLERPVYRVGRVLGISMLRLRTGDHVLDVGCGTGLNFPLLHRAVGRTGAVVGIDASEPMLAMAAKRVTAQGWSNVDVRRGDAAKMERLLRPGEMFDAVLYTYALSVIDDWERAWDQGVAALRPGGRALVVDLALPTGGGRVLSPLARVACFAGGSDPHRQPWRPLICRSPDAVQATARSGHIHLAAGTPPSRAQATG